MALVTKHHSTALIRTARPAVHPNALFVDQLSQQLQHRASQLRLESVPAVAQPAKFTWLFGTMGLGALAAAVVVVAFIPAWLSGPAPLTGYIQKGPFISGSDITVQELDDQLQPTGQSYQVTTNSDFGDYLLEQDIKATYVEVIAQGFYFDEVQGVLSAAPLSLRSIADVSANQGVNVNVLTTLASPRIRYLVAETGLSFSAAKQQAEQEVLKIFKIETMSVGAFETMSISEAGESNGVLLAVSAIIQGQQSVAQVAELLSKLSLAIQTDGNLADSDSFMNIITSNATQLNSYAIRENLKQRFAELGVTASVPAFEQFIKPLALTADPFAYQITLLDNVFGVDHTSGATIKVTLFGSDFQADQEAVSLKNLVPASNIHYVDNHTLIVEFPIDQLAAGSYTVVVQNTITGRTGVTDGEPLETTVNHVQKKRLILRGYAPSVTKVTAAVSYVNGGTITIYGSNFAYGTFVWINDWQVPTQAIRVASDSVMYVDLSSALIANNPQLPRHTNLTLTIQTPDFQTADFSGFTIR
ncbi:MAG: hypothetical protein HYV33_05695 [Candidatus Kerfeldbacteria bacterium]|nr:hypothetical protein [Candidatus Kerfeldbacteria bacterium]